MSERVEPDPPGHERSSEDTASSDDGADSGSSSAPPPRASLNAEGMERPKFLLEFPNDPRLEPLIDAFEAGNYAFVREHAETVAREATDLDVRDAALELRRRIEPDPLAKYLLALSVALLVFLVLWTYLGHHHSP